jgi:hypothetical protein
MVRKILSVLLIATFTSIAAQAADPGGIGLEVPARDIVIPVEDRGYITCNTCSTRDLALTPTTSYEIGDEQVRREAMRRELLQRPNQVMLLQLTPDRKHVARLKIIAAYK